MKKYMCANYNFQYIVETNMNGGMMYAKHKTCISRKENER